MLEYCFENLGLVYEADYLHSSFTLGAGERINLVNLLGQPCLVGVAFLAIRRIRFLTGNFMYLGID